MSAKKYSPPVKQASGCHCVYSLVDKIGLCTSYACCMRPCYSDHSKLIRFNDDKITWKHLVEGCGAPRYPLMPPTLSVLLG